MKILDDKYRRGKNLAFSLHIPDERQGYVLCYSLYENDELLIFCESWPETVPSFKSGYRKQKVDCLHR